MGEKEMCRLAGRVTMSHKEIFTRNKEIFTDGGIDREGAERVLCVAMRMVRVAHWHAELTGAEAGDKQRDAGSGSGTKECLQDNLQHH
jgi:hypothetical protein